MVEYTRSLGAVGVTVQHFLYQLVINALVRTRHFYQLHQLLQYHVLADSKPLVGVGVEDRCILVKNRDVADSGEGECRSLIGEVGIFGRGGCDV